jgi:hypothetical protein
MEERNKLVLGRLATSKDWERFEILLLDPLRLVAAHEGKERGREIQTSKVSSWG